MFRTPDFLHYPLKSIRIYIFRLFFIINKRVLRTYQSNSDCARCEDCGVTVHDFQAPDKVWLEVYGREGGILCFDCFNERAQAKGFLLSWSCSVWTGGKGWR